MARRRVPDDLTAFLREFAGFARWRAAWVAALVGVGAVFEGFSLLLVVPLMQVLTVAPGRTGLAGAVVRPLLRPLAGFGHGAQLLILVAAAMALMALRGAVLSRRDLAGNRLQLAFVEAIRLRLVRRLSAGSWQGAARMRHARLVQALTVEIHQVGTAAHSLVLAAVAAVMLAANAAFAILLAPAAAPVVLGFALAMALASRPYLDRASRLGGSIAEAHAAMTEASTSFLSGMKLATAQGLNQAFLDHYEAAAASALDDRLRFTAAQAALRSVTAIAAAAVGAGALLAGVLAFHLGLPVLVALLVVLSRMAAPAQALQQGAQQVLHNLPAYSRVRALDQALAESAPAQAAGSPPQRASRRDRIILSNVTFGYGPLDIPGAVLRNVSLVIPSGAFVGVTGPSGAGKTTALDLVAGLLSPQAGRIYVDGRELAGEGLAQHRAGLAYVAQEAFLLDDTVRRNLAWGAAGASEAQMLAALELVGAKALLRRLEQGLDTRLGDRGALISAGERQRLALARALLRRPTLLVLDEATNAIDVAGERTILASLARLAPRTTILMAAHRSESLAACDHILRFPGPVLTRREPDGQPALSAS